MADKIYVHELTCGELREIIVQAVFGKSDNELMALCAEHGIVFFPIYGYQDGMDVHGMPIQYLNSALQQAIYAVMARRIPIERFQTDMTATCRIPDGMKVWEWE